MPGPLWIPSADRIARSNLTRFMREVSSRWQTAIDDYASLYRFSIERPGEFWDSIWSFADVIGDRGERVVDLLDRLPGARFFPDARLNFTENLLRRQDEGPAIVFRDEAGRCRTLSWRALHGQVAAFAAALAREGVTPGDRVAGYLPNIPEAIVAALGTAAVGGVWSSCSPDFGVQGVLDRFGQIEPVVPEE